jgi:hypothetical protein
MKRIDHLIGATVSQIDVSRNGSLRLTFRQTDESRARLGFCWDFNPLTVEIPREPKRRKKQAPR